MTFVPKQDGRLESEPAQHAIEAKPTRVYPELQYAVYCSECSTSAVLGSTKPLAIDGLLQGFPENK